ncbi:unnamed protein product, partial [Iphiclides podalirius]
MWKPMILDVECIVCNKSLQKINHIPSEVPVKMRKITSRRCRTPNWSLDEKQFLLELIKERKEVIVTKSNNGPNHSEEKDVAWNEILKELTKKFGNKFSDSSIKKVKTQWQNMKRIAREEMSLSGSDIQKYTRQSLEVCNILELVKDGILRKDDESNETELNTNVEIKAECLDEDMLQPSGNEEGMFPFDQSQQDKTTNSTFESSSSSTSEQMSEVVEPESPEINMENISTTNKSVDAMTDMSLMDRFNINPLHSELQNFFKYSTTEKQLKLETLKEERQVVRAMREAAELNKIIAEQKLKHILWVKKIETGPAITTLRMYSGEPGSGAGKGGGTGGAIRDAGGSFGKMQAAREDEYFYKKQKEQIASMKGMIDQEVAFHKDQIKRHEDAIRRHLEQKDKLEEN